jgi:DNA-binding response OmpR family regulator
MTRFALIVEDDPVLQDAMVHQLERMGFDVAAVSHYDDAVHHLTSRRPDLVCLDLGLPTRSGYDLCEHIRGPLGLALVPILVTSGFCFARDMANAEEAGANAFLKKPFSMHQLESYVQALLEKRHPSEPYLRRLQL